MKRIIEPPRDELSRLRQPLTPGEQIVLDFFDYGLPLEWEIYIQPHLNGLRPDFVLLNPKVGIAVFEVKDWNLDAMHYFIRDDELWAEKDGKEFYYQKENPITKVNLYKKDIYELYCPRIGARASDYRSWAVVTAGVIFPFADTARIKDLFKPFLPQKENYLPVSGREEIQRGNICKVFPESARKNSFFMEAAFADDLRSWLVEPDFASTQRQPLGLDQNQRVLADTRTESGYRRIRGPAGSGKSLVLAARAANLINEGKSILVVTFNITLLHYLRDLIVRGLKPQSRRGSVVYMNFHAWCKRACYDVGWEKRYEKLFKEDMDKKYLLNEKIPALAEDAISQAGAVKYDAILVDEGQDYLPYWWSVLQKVRRDAHSEMLLVADATQDIYGTATAWTDDVMRNAGFRGNWAQLNVSYRLPPTALDMACKFAQQFLPEETIDMPLQDQNSLIDYPCQLRWVQCYTDKADSTCIDELFRLMKLTGKKSELANADIIFLTDSTKFGAKVIERLDTINVHTVHTFADSIQKQHCQKMGFYMGDARIKATTLQSFKGWEGRMIVVYIAQAYNPESLALIYAGLTRLKRDTSGSWLTVISSAPELEAYGKTWPSFSVTV